MARRFVVSSRLYLDAVQLPKVRRALAARAERIAERAAGEAKEAGIADFELWIEHGTRPRGRSFSRVGTPQVDQEFGTAETPKRRILGRAAGLSLPPPGD